MPNWMIHNIYANHCIYKDKGMKMSHCLGKGPMHMNFLENYVQINFCFLLNYEGLPTWPRDPIRDPILVFMKHG
jgi:hypothetical protein